jgi:hypothetical protein
MSFKALLRRWQSHPRAAARTEERYRMRLPVEDAARVLALAEIYGIPEEEVITDLLHVALQEVTEAMPYVPGEKIIREDDFGDPVYEDEGPMPRFLELARRKRAELARRK